MKKLFLCIIIQISLLSSVLATPVKVDLSLPYICPKCFSMLSQNIECTCDETFLCEPVKEIQKTRQNEIFIEAIEQQNIPLIIAILNQFKSNSAAREIFVINAKKDSSDPDTSLMKAIKTRNEAIIFLLIKTIKNNTEKINFISYQNKLGQTAGSLALFANNVRIMRFLISEIKEKKAQIQFAVYALKVYNAAIICPNVPLIQNTCYQTTYKFLYSY